MDISGLMVSTSDSCWGGQRSFSGRRVCELAFQLLWGFYWNNSRSGSRNDRFYSKMWGKTVRWRGRGMWNFCEAPHELWYQGSCRIHVRRYVMHGRVDYWIMWQNCRNTWHEFLNWWVHKIRPCCGWKRSRMQKSEPVKRLHVSRPNMVKQGRMYSKQN